MAAAPADATVKTPSTTLPVLTDDQVRQWMATELPLEDFRGKKLLLIVPDATRTAPLPLLFGAIFDRLRPVVDKLDVMIALGTHPPMSDVQMCKLLGIQPEERDKLFFQTELINHEWDNPEALTTIGTLTKADTERVSQGMLSQEVPVKINKRILDYDTLLVLGPVFPHEVVGFSGGNKYFFPGISGPELLNFFHWLGALITNVGIIGVKSTPVRDVVNLAAKMIPRERKAITFVVTPDGSARLHGLFYNTPEQAWSDAADLSEKVHIKRMPKAYHTVLSCAPLMYDELWVAGKCMYKLEPVVADGGELIIYAPHMHEISIVHGKTIEAVGYHCRDYFLKQWDKFKHYPWGTLAHSTHVRGGGTFENGVENCRVKVTVASQIPPELLEKINLGYRDPASINIEDYADREDEGVLLVRKAGEQLYRLAE
ncbi:lactate racemase domain-containing protein [Planctomicrobium piriforme]|uniref:Nickel-dependent lactate racemase n=1 Tax=Planctomicrobium piriforme TaxID=1576369 RepID=A0A1I3RPF9_9PLAN|nr:lactate racemase domain-containing protein [Planctomicrobium piriforme]SFJ47782.1 Nickel-dependent lactate racemase [Planctomicrobium piriforme]